MGGARCGAARARVRRPPKFHPLQTEWGTGTGVLDVAEAAAVCTIGGTGVVGWAARACRRERQSRRLRVGGVLSRPPPAHSPSPLPRQRIPCWATKRLPLPAKSLASHPPSHS